jgi:bifunctional N-acetylglucosamine-1-phosphate-uridyltransferase/glucosamine-1-phosphate-acetyltransferase GlmU-like protein
MSVTFDSVELKNPEPIDIDHQVSINDTVLLSGKHSIQGSSETSISATFKCHTETYLYVTNLRAKIGTEASLVIDSTTYTKCHISAWSEKEWAKDKWEYTVGFKQDTT